MARLTTQEFINRAIAIHGDKFDYSKVIYFSAKDKVIITCKDHGDFLQAPTNHLSGNGCRECQKITLRKLKIKTQDQFILESKEIHGDKYDYSKAIYKGSYEKVKIICPLHGEFEQLAREHSVNGCGCPDCGGRKKHSLENFIRISNIVHRGRYDYSRAKYENNKSRILIKCPDHGFFEQAAADHLNGKGCRACGFEYTALSHRDTTESFVNKAKDVHGNKYDYSNVIYGLSNRDSVEIICKDHGSFNQIPANHLMGQGCPKCASFGFNRNVSGVLYLLESCSSGYLKIGIANDLNKRFSILKRSTPFYIKVKSKILFKVGEGAFINEQNAHKLFDHLNCGFSGFDGATEWFYHSQEILDWFESLKESVADGVSR